MDQVAIIRDSVLERERKGERAGTTPTPKSLAVSVVVIDDVTNSTDEESPISTSSSAPHESSINMPILTSRPSSPSSIRSTNSNGIFAIGAELVAPREAKRAGETLVDLDGLLGPSEGLRLHEDLANGCGGMLWPAGMALARYMLRVHGGTMAGKRVVEIGAGGGLVGLAVAKGSPTFTAPLVITDQLAMLSLMERNITLNGLGDLVSAAVYDWGSPAPAAVSQHPDVILAADCVYYEPAFPLLHRTLVDLIGERTVCFFCFKKRRRADMHFIKGIKKVFDVVAVDDDVDQSRYKRENIHMLKITKRKAK